MKRSRGGQLKELAGVRRRRLRRGCGGSVVEEAVGREGGCLRRWLGSARRLCEGGSYVVDEVVSRGSRRFCRGGGIVEKAMVWKCAENLQRINSKGEHIFFIIIYLLKVNITGQAATVT